MEYESNESGNWIVYWPCNLCGMWEISARLEIWKGSQNKKLDKEAEKYWKFI